MAAGTSKALSRAERIAALHYDYAAQSKQFVERCNLCSASNWTILTHVDRYGFPAQTVLCDRCGLVMLNPRMTTEAYSQFYECVYRPLVSAYHGRLIDAHTVQAEQRIYAEEMAEFIEPFVRHQRGGSFLDVGGSTGVIAAHFARRFGVHSTVIDPAPDEVAEARALGIESVQGFIEQWDAGGRSFDIVGMFQTIDHLLDIAATLAKIRTILRPNGLFVVDILDFRAAYLNKGSVEAATKIDHPFYLVEETALAYLARAGFQPVRRAYSREHWHVAFVCSPAVPQPDALPQPGFVEQQRRELRTVQSGLVAPAITSI